MKFYILIILYVALLGVLIEGLPYKVHYRKLPYTLKNASTLRKLLHTIKSVSTSSPIKVRRAVLGEQISTNPADDSNMDLTHSICTPEQNVIEQVFATGNTERDLVATGATLAYNNDVDAGISKEHIHDVHDTLNKILHADLFNDDTHKMNANILKSDDTLASGFKFELNGHGLGYSNIDVYDTSLTQNKIPNFSRKLKLAGKTKLCSL